MSLACRCSSMATTSPAAHAVDASTHTSAPRQQVTSHLDKCAAARPNNYAPAYTRAASSLSRPAALRWLKNSPPGDAGGGGTGGEQGGCGRGAGTRMPAAVSAWRLSAGPPAAPPLTRHVLQHKVDAGGVLADAVQAHEQRVVQRRQHVALAPQVRDLQQRGGEVRPPVCGVRCAMREAGVPWPPSSPSTTARSPGGS